MTPHDSFAPLRLPEFRYLIASLAVATIASRALAVVVGYQVYELTGEPLALGLLGLVEVIPAMTLALFGGYVADRSDRRWIMLATDAVSVACALLFALIAWKSSFLGVELIFLVVFVAGIARGFSDPATAAFEAQVVPREMYVRASTWQSSVWQASAIVGPMLGGLAYQLLGVVNTYLAIALLFVIGWCFVYLIAQKPTPAASSTESIWANIAEGVRYVFRDQALSGSMALDLFAVLFGGAIALLPVFAKDILKVGAVGLGMMNAAPSIGALLVMLWCTQHPPLRNAGRNLFLCVAGFGVTMIVFALSQNICLSLFALAASGACDGVSVVIRKSILRLRSPDGMRGRISSVGSIFISASNELGAFESGVAAHYLGTIRSVWLGGVATLVVVASVFFSAPQLRELDLTTPRREDEITPPNVS